MNKFLKTAINRLTKDDFIFYEGFTIKYTNENCLEISDGIITFLLNPKIKECTMSIEQSSPTFDETSNEKTEDMYEFDENEIDEENSSYQEKEIAYEMNDNQWDNNIENKGIISELKQYEHNMRDKIDEFEYVINRINSITREIFNNIDNIIGISKEDEEKYIDRGNVSQYYNIYENNFEDFGIGERVEKIKDYLEKIQNDIDTLNFNI